MNDLVIIALLLVAGVATNAGLAVVNLLVYRALRKQVTAQRKAKEDTPA